MDKLKVAVVGAGRATRELTLPAFDFISKGKLCAVCALDFEAAKEVATSLGIPAYSDFSEMLDKENPQVVIINTPVTTHTDLAITAMERGCHVIIEKPVVAESEELEKLKEVRDRTGMKLTGVHNYKFYEGPQRALAMYKKGILGEILHIDRIWMSPPQIDRMERNPEGWWHKTVGGRLIETIPHLLYIPYMFVGPMELVSVSARKLAKDRPWSFCDESDIVLQTPRAYVNIHQSLNQESAPYKGYLFYTFLHGSKLSAEVNHHRAEIIWKDSNLRNVARGMKSSVNLVRNQVRNRLVKLLPKDKRGEISRGAHNVFYEKFFDYVMDKGPNPTSWEELVNVATLTTQIALKMQECVDQNKKIVV